MHQGQLPHLQNQIVSTKKCPLKNHMLKLIAMNTTSGAPCDLFMIA